MNLEDDKIDIDAIMAELESDTTEIEPIANVVAEIEKEAAEVPVVKDEDAIDLEVEGELSQRIVKNSLNVINAAKSVYTSFSDDVFKGNDRSTSSKEAMLRALDVQNSANKNMIDLAKVLANKDKNGTNILINTISEKKAGVNFSNMKDSFNN
ncbi:MAG: hypothetical protein DRJ01_00635 [Bacteroidetes bacterium]|nr:MAG: hypothetical protein DRJ01_00635 [Bacteroidota bacterium]